LGHPGVGQHPYLVYPHPLLVPPLLQLNANFVNWKAGAKWFFKGAFLLRRDWTDGLTEQFGILLRTHWPMCHGVRPEEIIAELMPLAAHCRQMLLDNITNVVLEWQRNRPLGQWWLFESLNTWPANPHGGLQATWRIWFTQTVSQVQHNAGFVGSHEQQAFVDFYAWCLRPFNVVRIWRHVITYIRQDLISAWIHGLPQPLPIFAQLRRVVAQMLKPIFEHCMKTIFHASRRYRYGFGGDIFRHLYHQDEMTAAHYGDLVQANVNPNLGLREHRLRQVAWINGLDNEG